MHVRINILLLVRFMLCFCLTVDINPLKFLCFLLLLLPIISYIF